MTVLLIVDIIVICIYNMIQGKSMHLAFEAERLSSVFYFRSSGFYACLGEFPGGGNVIL